MKKKRKKKKKHRSHQDWVGVRRMWKAGKGSGQGSQLTGRWPFHLCVTLRTHPASPETALLSPAVKPPRLPSCCVPLLPLGIMFLVSILIYFQAAELLKMLTMFLHFPWTPFLLTGLNIRSFTFTTQLFLRYILIEFEVLAVFNELYFPLSVFKSMSALLPKYLHDYFCIPEGIIRLRRHRKPSFKPWFAVGKVEWTGLWCYCW